MSKFVGSERVYCDAPGCLAWAASLEVALANGWTIENTLHLCPKKPEPVRPKHKSGPIAGSLNTYTHNELTIFFARVDGLNSAWSSIHRCGVCSMLVEASYKQAHTIWHERLGDQE